MSHGYFTLDGSIWLLVVLALAPDLSMVGYRKGAKIGSWSYNLVHTYTLPVCLGVVGVWSGTSTALLVALIWAGHIGADRFFGYGLKFESGFKHTHLSPQIARFEESADSE